MQRAFGYKRDDYDPRDVDAEHLLGKGAREDLVVSATMKGVRGPRIFQGRANTCGPHALWRAIYMLLRMALVAAGKVDDEPSYPSRLFMYFGALREEIAAAIARGAQYRPIADVGCYPRLLMRFVQRCGFCREDMWPYTDDPAVVLQTPPSDAFRCAFDQSNLRYYRVNSKGRARVAEIARALAQRKPVILGMFADSAFQRNAGELVTAVDMNDPDGGWHMMAVLSVSVNPDAVELDNWWEDWGREDGTGIVSFDVIGSEAVGDVYVIESAPTFSDSEVAA